jgi:D-sedoheptulose 7-phosphate isomerase
MKDIILDILEAGITAKRSCVETNLDTIIKAADLLTDCMAGGNKVLIFGNGGSAADAQHLAAEFVNRFLIERPPLAAIALTTDTSGNSTNVIQAVKTARKMGIFTIGMTGRGGELAECADLVFSVDSDTTARVQETHITLGHILCELLERKLYPEQFNN